MRRSLAYSIALIVTIAAGGPALAQGNLDNGADVYKTCRACHLIGEGARHTVGPTLNGVIGRKAGAGEGYIYSENIKELGANGLVWDDASLDRYLENPKSVVPRGKMAFPGLKEKTDRDDVIAYLKQSAK